MFERNDGVFKVIPNAKICDDVEFSTFEDFGKMVNATLNIMDISLSGAASNIKPKHIRTLDIQGCDFSITAFQLEDVRPVECADVQRAQTRQSLG